MINRTENTGGHKLRRRRVYLVSDNGEEVDAEPSGVHRQLADRLGRVCVEPDAPAVRGVGQHADQREQRTQSDGRERTGVPEFPLYEHEQWQIRCRL